MNRDKLFEDIPIFALLLILIVMRFVPPEYKDYLLWGGVGSALGFIILSEYAFRVRAAQYLYILGIVCPSNEKLHMFIKEPRDGVHSREIDPNGHWYETPLTLGEPLRSKNFQGVRQFVLKHQLTWEKRFIALPGHALYRGYSVPHPRTATLVLWIPKEGQTMIDHCEPIPVFVVAHAPRDYYLAADPVTVDVPAVTNEKPGTDIELSKNDANALAFKQENEELKRKNVELERYGFTQHRNIIRIEGEFRQIKNEFRGALSRTRDVSKLVLEELLTVLSAHSEIEEAVNEYRKRPWITITVGLALLILGGFGLYEYSYNPDFRAGIEANIWPLIIIAVCAVFIVMFFYGRRRRR